jgi:hypothetical protein
MKITNWCKKLSATLVAAGVLVPGVSYAINIPLGDPSFEAYTVPAFPGGDGFAYAQPIYSYTGAYRPTSPWVDDLDSPPSYTQDDGNSNWIYNSAYAESGSAARRRAAPRTGDQAMHGLFNYNAQETNAVFEANRIYTFSVWAQGDDDASSSSSRVFLYMFDGSVPFSEANSLTFERFGVDTGDFANRARSMTQAQSQANWTQISLSHFVAAGAPEIGHPVGVGFYIADDGAIDDATLTSVVPEPTTVILVGLGGLAILVLRRR